MSLDYTKAGPALLVDLINKSNGTLFKVGDLSFSAPAAYDNPAKPEKNTTVTCTGTGTTRFKGPKDVYYRRLDLDQVVAGRDDEFNIKAGDGLDTLLGLVNARFERGLDQSDAGWDATGPIVGTELVTVSAKPGSYTYFGEMILSVTAAAADDSILVEPETLPSAAVDEQFQTDAGYLLVGTGNPVGGMQLSSNGEIQLGGSIRKYNNASLIAQTTEGHYDVALAAGEDWIFPIVFGLVDDRNASLLTDLYDLSLTVRNEANAKTIVLKLVWDRANKKFDLVDEAAGINITNSATNAAGTAFQGIQRVTFYKEQLGVTTETATGAPLGTYSFVYKATRKLGDAEQIIEGFNVTVTNAA